MPILFQASGVTDGALAVGAISRWKPGRNQRGGLETLQAGLLRFLGGRVFRVVGIDLLL